MTLRINTFQAAVKIFRMHKVTKWNEKENYRLDRLKETEKKS